MTVGIYWSSLSCEKPENYYYNGWNYYQTFDEDGKTQLILANDYDLGNRSLVNHEVVIVGWDDDYSRDNFRYDIEPGTLLYPEATASNARMATDSNAGYEIPAQEEKRRARLATDSSADSEQDEERNAADEEWEEFLDSMLPEEDGAWIVRNSWGDGAGEDGYYYVSYCDDRIVSNDNAWAYEATETTDNYNKMYQITSLPYSGEMEWTTSANMIMASTVFTAEEDGADLLKAVSFDLKNSNVRYEIAVNQGEDVGKGWMEENVYASGTKMYAGYYTVRLDKTILLQPGEKIGRAHV